MKQEAGGDGWAWVRLSEGLAAGIHHALNNRMAALGGAAQVLQSDLEIANPLVDLLSSEIHRMESTTGLLRLLGPSGGGLEPVQLGEVLSQARRLFEIHHALRNLQLEIDAPEDLLPVWSAPVVLLRTVLMMLAAAGGGMPVSMSWGVIGDGGAIPLTVSGDAATVRIIVEVQERVEDAELPQITKDDVAAMAARVGGRLLTSEGPASSRWELELLTLPEARRRERENAL